MLKSDIGRYWRYNVKKCIILKSDIGGIILKSDIGGIILKSDIGVYIIGRIILKSDIGVILEVY